MATPTIPNGEEYFFPIIYEGNGAGQRVGKFVPFTDNGTIDNSCIFNGATNNYLSRTPSSNGSGTTLTFSCWVKRGNLGMRDIMFTNDFSANGEVLQFDASNRLYYYKVTSGWSYVSNRTFEDTSKWYNIVIVRNTNDSTASDRVKIYVDGDRITSFSSSSDPSLGATGYWNQTTLANVVGNTGNASYIRGIGYLAEVNMIDGQALLPASFGLTDTSTGRWIPSVVKPYPTTTTTFTVTVSNPGSGNKYYIDSSQQATVTLIEGATYRFDQSDSSNSGHPLRFSTTSDGTHGGGSEYTTGVTAVGTPGSSGAYTEITVATGAPTLYYYCTNHSGMGGTANTQDQYGTNGFRLKFQDSSALGDDTSGNTNDFTATNLSASDQTTDSPTQNHTTLSSSRTRGTITLSEGNLKIASGATSYANSATTFRFSETASQGLYFEAKQVGSISNGMSILLMRNTVNVSGLGNNQQFADCFGLQSRGGGGGNTYWTSENGANGYDTSVSHALNDYVQVAFKDGKVWFGINNTWIGSGNPATGANPTYDNISGQDFRFLISVYENNVLELNFGQKSFNYTPPTGFVALQQDNLPETAKGISGFTWTKNRDGTDWHYLVDSSRGNTKALNSNDAAAEETHQNGVQKFLKGGISIEDRDNVNKSGNSFVNFTWVANGGSTSSNTDGSITSTVQANTTAGFSIVQYTGTGSAATVGHGLSQAPEWFIIKSLSLTTNWYVYHKSMGATYQMYLNLTSAQDTSVLTAWNDTAPTSSVISLPPTGYGSNNASATYLIYAWHGVDGFSKFGSYTGNGSTDGTFVYTGFKPSFLIVKSTAAANWNMFDSARNTFNPVKLQLYADTTEVDYDLGARGFDFLSNGFKLRQETGYGSNNSGQDYIYMAFAEHPFVGDGTSPVTAR